MIATLLFMGIGMQELIVIVLIVLLLFGGKKIPELMKGDRRRPESRHEGRRKQADPSEIIN